MAFIHSQASPDEAYFAARNLIKAQKLPAAELIFRELVRHAPDDLRYQEGFLDVLRRLKRTDEMLEHFRRLVDRLDPTGDSDYHAIYMSALSATANSPIPLLRMLRFYELVVQLQPTLHLRGDVVECGCFRGMSSYLICSYLRRHDAEFSGRGYHIFDSFQGLAAPTLDDEIPSDHQDARRLRRMSRAGEFCASLETVRNSLAEFPEINFRPGWIPLSFKGLPVNTYRFVHVDVDLYDPTADCLEYFFPRLVAGGKIVSDDYSWPGARKAMDEFCVERGIMPVITPYNQAVLTKE